jgi:DNA polymerase-1
MYRLQVHDELLFEVSSSHLPRVAALVRQVMEGVADVWDIQLPMPVKVRVGPSWGQLELFEPPATQQL